MDREIINNINTSWEMLESLVIKFGRIQKEGIKEEIPRVITEGENIVTLMSQINGALLAEGIKFPDSSNRLFNRVGEYLKEIKRIKYEKLNFNHVKRLIHLVLVLLWVVSNSIKWGEQYLQEIWVQTNTNAFLKVYLRYILSEEILQREENERKNRYIAQVMMENSELKSSIILLREENKELRKIISNENNEITKKEFQRKLIDIKKLQSRIDFLLWVIERKNQEISLLKEDLERKAQKIQEMQKLTTATMEQTKKLNIQYQKELQRLRTEMEEYRTIATTKAFKTIRDTLTFLNREIKKLKEENTKLREYIKRTRKK